MLRKSLLPNRDNRGRRLSFDLGTRGLRRRLFFALGSTPKARTRAQILMIKEETYRSSKTGLNSRLQSRRVVPYGLQTATR